LTVLDFNNARSQHEAGKRGKARGKIQVLDIDDLEKLRPPEWLVDGIITKNGLSMLWGRSGAMKSFVGVDFGLCVASGMAWHGKAVQRGRVYYVAAEGAYGLIKRVLGWCATRGRDLPEPDFLLIPQPVALAQEVDELVGHILSHNETPMLIIIDTVARTFGGGDENKQQDMNAYVQALDRLRIATGAHVMVIHHSGVGDAKRERGSNVLRGAADTIIKVSRNGNRIDLVNRAPEGKQKDFEEFATVKLEAVRISYVSIDGEEVSTIVLGSSDMSDEIEDEPDEGDEETEEESEAPWP
jgi:RecA-family ATPase